jgi:hypothetical protein
MITLEYSGTEKDLGAWGFDLDSPQLEFANMAPDVLDLAMPGVDITSDPVIGFEEKIILRKGRAGSGTTWAGGSIEFVGTRMPHILDGRPEYEGVHYRFAGPWWDIEKTPFMQSFKTYTGDPDALGTVVFSDCILFQRYDTITPGSVVRVNTGDQINDIFQHVLDMYTALSLGAPFQIGTIDPAVNVPTYQVRDILCSEAIRICLRSAPDATVYFNYSTTPPTVNVRTRANQTPVSLAFANGTDHKSIRIIPREDLQVRAVNLYFKSTGEFDGVPWLVTTQQKYGPHGLNSGSDPDGGPRVLVQTIDLQGASRADVFGSIACAAVNCNASGDVDGSGSPSNRRVWWSLPTHKPEFASSRIRNMTVGDASIVEVQADGTLGSAVDLGDFPNELLDGTIAAWMKLSGGTPVAGKRVIVTAKMTYDEYDSDGTSGSVNASNGNLLHHYIDKEVSVHFTITNGITGVYSAIASSVAGEEIPSGLAQSIFDSLSALQFEGTDLRVEDEITGLVGMNNVLNLTDGRSEWATMDAQVQRIVRRYGRGYSEVTIGPAAHLSPGDLTTLFQFNRFRRIYYDPSVQATAAGGGGSSSVTLGNNAPKNNSTHGLENKSLTAVAAPEVSTNSTQVINDASNKKIALQVVDNASPPARIDAKGWVEISLAGSGSGTDLGVLGSDGNRHKVYLQETEICETIEGTPTVRRVIMLRSDSFAAP